MPTVRERIANLEAFLSSPLGDVKDGMLKETQTKVGRGLNYLLFDPGPDGNSTVKTHVEGANNPGFTFNSRTSEIRPGEILTIQTKMSNLVFSDGMAFNPKAKFLPPNLVNFYPPMIPSLGDVGINAILTGIMQS